MLRAALAEPSIGWPGGSESVGVVPSAGSEEGKRWVSGSGKEWVKSSKSEWGYERGSGQGERKQQKRSRQGSQEQ